MKKRQRRPNSFLTCAQVLPQKEEARACGQDGGDERRNLPLLLRVCSGGRSEREVETAESRNTNKSKSWLLAHHTMQQPTFETNAKTKKELANTTNRIT